MLSLTAFQNVRMLADHIKRRNDVKMVHYRSREYKAGGREEEHSTGHVERSQEKSGLPSQLGHTLLVERGGSDAAADGSVRSSERFRTPGWMRTRRIDFKSTKGNDIQRKERKKRRYCAHHHSGLNVESSRSGS